MEPMWHTRLILAIAFFYSKFYNTRRVEHPTYAAWNTVLHRLLPYGESSLLNGDVGDTLAVAPQFEVYTSLLDVELNANDPRASISTKADSTAKSLFFDFAILHFTPAMRHGDLWADGITAFMNYLLKAPWASGAIARVVEAARLRIGRTDILAIIELKRPPSRSLRIDIWMKLLTVLIRAAQEQALTQVVCVLRSKRYNFEGKKMRGLFLIAGAGEWFTLRWVDLAVITAEPPWDAVDFKAKMDLFADQQAALEDLEARVQEANPKVQLGPSAEALARQEQNDARAARVLQRELNQQDPEVLAKRKEELLALTPPFTDDELQQYWTIDPLEKLSKRSSFVHQMPTKFDEETLKGWTRPMRLGSPVGEAYLKHVFKKIQTTVIEMAAIPATK